MPDSAWTTEMRRTTVFAGLMSESEEIVTVNVDLTNYTLINNNTMTQDSVRLYKWMRRDLPFGTIERLYQLLKNDPDFNPK